MAHPPREESREQTDPTSGRGEVFARQAEQRSGGILREFFDFLRTNKKWWLAPIIIVLLLLSVLMILGGSSLAPFIYTLF